LDKEGKSKDKEEDPAVEELLEDVVFAWSNHTAVDFVEELEEDKGCEDHSQVNLLGFGHSLLFAGVWYFSIYLGASISSLGVLVVVKSVHSSTEPDDEEHNRAHPGSNSIDLAPDSLAKDLCVNCDSWLVNHRGQRRLSCKGQSSKYVHDEVDPDELDSIEWRLSQEDCS